MPGVANRIGYPSLSGTFSRAGVKFNFIVTLVRSTTYVAQMALNRPEPPTTAFDFMQLDKITILSNEQG